jgi:hypothetical protein
MKPEVVAELKRYEKLTLEKRAIENELEMIKEELVPQLPADKPIETQDGVFTVEARLSWKYSDATTNQEKVLKDMKTREQQDGTATATPGKSFLVYRTGHE